MGRKKKRHKGRSARKRIAQTIANSAIQWVRLERSHVKLYRLEKRIAWRRGYHSHEKRAFVTTQPNRGRAMVKCGPVVYHLVSLVGDKWETKHFSTRSIRSTRIKGLHTPKRSLFLDGNMIHFRGFTSQQMEREGLKRGEDYSHNGSDPVMRVERITYDTLVEYRAIVSQSEF